MGATFCKFSARLDDVFLRKSDFFDSRNCVLMMTIYVVQFIFPDSDQYEMTEVELINISEERSDIIYMFTHRTICAIEICTSAGRI